MTEDSLTPSLPRGRWMLSRTSPSNRFFPLSDSRDPRAVSTRTEERSSFSFTCLPTIEFASRDPRFRENGRLSLSFVSSLPYEKKRDGTLQGSVILKWTSLSLCLSPRERQRIHAWPGTPPSDRFFSLADQRSTPVPVSRWSECLQNFKRMTRGERSSNLDIFSFTDTTVPFVDSVLSNVFLQKTHGKYNKY